MAPFKLVILIWELVFFVGAVLPPYLRVFEGNQQDCDSIIENYFKLEISYKEIIVFLLLTHGIVLSLRQLKRILRKRGLFRRRNGSNHEEVIRAVEIGLQGSGSSVGYRQMHQRLIIDHNMVSVDRESVRMIVKTLDPQGVACRSKRKRRRRKYSAKGPNWIWHLDGYDKLKLYGFSIHGAIDVFMASADESFALKWA